MFFLFFSFFLFFFTFTIQNKNSKQINKKYIKITITTPKQSGIFREQFCKPEQCSAGFLGAGTVAARLPTRHRHRRRVGSRAATRRPQQQGVSGSTSSPLLFLAGGEEHHYLQNTKKTQATVCFCFYFRSVLLGSFLPILDL